MPTSRTSKRSAEDAAGANYARAAVLKFTGGDVSTDVDGLPASLVLAISAHRDAVIAHLGLTTAAPKLPALTARGAKRYIAAVARHVSMGLLSAKDANSLLYAAQLLIAADRAGVGSAPSRAVTPRAVARVLPALPESASS